MGKMKTALLLLPAIFVMFAWPADASAFRSDFGYGDSELTLSDGDKNIQTILRYGQCVKNEQRERVGKWLCYVSRMAGIQTNESGQAYSGRMTPREDKFFVTISEVSDDDKEIACRGGRWTEWQYRQLSPQSVLGKLQIIFKRHDG